MSSPATPAPKGRHGATGAEDDAIGDASGAESQTITPDRPLQPGFDTYGSGSHTADLHQAHAQSLSHDVSRPIPLRLLAPTGQPQGSQDDDPFSDAGFYEAWYVTGVEQETEATYLMDDLSEDAMYSAPIDAGKVKDAAMDDLVAPSEIDHGPHEQFREQPFEQPHQEHGAGTAASVPTTIEPGPVKEETALLEVFEDMQTTSLPQVHLQPPSQSRSSPDAQPASPKGKQVREAPAVPASDKVSAAPTLDAPKGLVTIPIPPHYHKVRSLLWLKKTIAESQPAPRTPSPKKPAKKAPGTSGARRKRASKKTPSKAPADSDDTWSPPRTRSAKKTANAARAARSAATQEVSPAPRATPIKRIILHFKRKPKTEDDGDAAPEPEDEEESSLQSSQRSGGVGIDCGSFYDLGADEPGAEADEDEGEDGYVDEGADAEEEVMLL